MTQKQLDSLEKKLQRTRMNKRFLKAPTVAHINGPTAVIEVIVRKASKDSGIPMDWCYQGGRGFIQSLGGRIESRNALFRALPQTDLTLDDWCSRLHNKQVC
jgi:hypothetical protein